MLTHAVVDGVVVAYIFAHGLTRMDTDSAALQPWL